MTNNTKIVATLGPASSTEEVLVKMIQAGVNVFRVNFSHGEHQTHRNTIRLIQKINQLKKKQKMKIFFMEI